MNPDRTFQLSAFLRGQLLILTAVLYTVVLCAPAFAACLLDRTGRWFSFFQRTWVMWVLRSNGIRLQVKGLQNMEAGRSYILISNHCSILDIPGIVAAFPVPVRFIAKKSLAWLPVFGWALYLSGHVMINRESALSAFKSIKDSIALLENGTSIIVFPEGTRSPDGQVKEFKRGAFLLAVQAKMSILPISILGTYEMLPRNGWCFWPGTMELRIGQPIPTNHFSQRQIPLLMEKAREAIIRNLSLPSPH